MTTKYEGEYRPLVIPAPVDISDGTHSVASLEGKAEGDQESVNSAAEATGTSVFTTGLPHPKQVA